MSRRGVALATAAVLVAGASGSCLQHPALVVGATTGALGFGACEIDNTKVGVCALTGVITGAFFGLLTAVIFHYTNQDQHMLRLDDEVGSDGTVRVHTFTPPPPVPLDAGIGSDVGSASSAAAVINVDAGVSDAPPAPPVPADAN